MAGAACATATSARFHEDVTVPETGSIPDMPTMSYGASLRADTRRTSICRLRWAPCWRVALRHSDVLAMACWMGPTRSRTVDYLPRQRFPSREASSFGEAFTAFVFGHAHIHSSIDVPTGSALCRHV
jgi:hypothetical protein